MMEDHNRPRHFRYTEENEAEMMAFARRWYKSHCYCGPRAWNYFRQNNHWARFVTADALRLKYGRLKRAERSQSQASASATPPTT